MPLIRDICTNIGGAHKASAGIITMKSVAFQGKEGKMIQTGSKCAVEM